MTRYTHRISLLNIKTPQAVILELERLEPLLSSSELMPVVFFNRAYLVVTKRINQAKLDGLFDHPKLMGELEVSFALRYFEALNYYVRNGSLPEPWNKINKSRFKRPPSLLLLLGANAHINYDLPLSLKDIIRNPQDFQNDYFKVNKLLRESGQEISKSYYHSKKSTNFLNKSLHLLFLRPTMWLILHWRTQAWLGFQ